MPAQKPHQSEQTVCTPREFLDAVEKRFGPIRIDLAATAENKVAPIHLGPGSEQGEDALKVHWHHFGSNQWLNPEFGDIDRFAEKCSEEAKYGARILLLTPYAVAGWFQRHILGKALVLPLVPRLRFVGHKADFPKDLQLNVFSPFVAPGWDLWRWKGTA